MNQIYKKTSFTHKVIICLLTGSASGAVAHRILRSYFGTLVSQSIINGIAIVILFAALAFILIWHFKEIKKPTPLERTHLWWQSVLCYVVAFDFTLFGWQKIFHQQFYTPLGILDMPFSEISNEWLVWSFFGRALPLCIIIGCLQIIGGLLMVFPRTRLLGIVFVLPIMLNILLIDIFYQMHIGIIVHVSIMFFGLIYLLLLDYTPLVEFFLKRKKSDNPNRYGWKNAFYLSVVVLPLLLISRFPKQSPHPELVGKYEVKKMSVDHIDSYSLPCNDSLLSVVYLELKDIAVFEFGHHKRRAMGIWNVTESGELIIDWFPPHNKESKVKVKFSLTPENNIAQMTGVMGKHNITAELVKVK